MSIFASCTRDSDKVAAFKFNCMSGTFTIKVRKMAWPLIVLFFKNQLNNYLSLHEIGEILLDITHSREKVKGVYDGVDFLTYLGARKI